MAAPIINLGKCSIVLSRVVRRNHSILKHPLDHKNRWSSFKLLNNVVNSAIQSRSNFALNELEALLQKHKPDFLSLSKNPVSLVT